VAHRIEVFALAEDTRAAVRQKKLKRLGFPVDRVEIVDTYTIDKDFSAEELAKIGSALANPVVQGFAVDKPAPATSFSCVVEVGFQPGVTDNIGATAKEIIEDLLKVKFADDEKVYTSQVTLLTGADGTVTAEIGQAVGESLANPLIQRIMVNQTGTRVPKVLLKHEPKVDKVDINLPDEELTKLGKEGVPNADGTRRGPLALDLTSLKAIQEYFARAGRTPTDVEIESLAQTWSEHCKHTIFAATLDEIKDGIYQYYIKRATNEIRATRAKEGKDFCVSVFKDNSGGIIFDDAWLVTDKVETHNSPSALDPFGGAITGIVGVNRDAMGFGLGAKPVANRYGFCFADPRDEKPLYRGPNKSQKMLSARRIMDGVIDGVNSGGNCSGIPTPQGFMFFDKSYKGKPLVFVGTVGLIPREINGKPSHEKCARPGDKIVVAGGRVGMDGIHGATFSSEAMDSGSPSTAVQIGDPITQKKMSDAIVKEARDMELYSSITDNGAGGLSCSVAEMAKESGGCSVVLDDVPTKYHGLDPWQIWISESQERMTLAVPPEHLDAFIDLMKRRGVETTVIGEFTDSGRCQVTYHGETIMDIDLDFLHDGLPHKTLTSTYTKATHEEPTATCSANLTDTLLGMMARPNLCSFDFVSHQFDHLVQGETIIGPLHGKGRVNGRASVIAPVLSSKKGVVLSQGLYPAYSEIDTYDMAACSIDTAIRNALSVGGSLDTLALLDNFCWCSSDEPERLGQLKEAARACYESATAYLTPFISGKDSMFNDFKGYDSEGNKIKISVLPTLLISSFGVIDDYKKCLTLDPKFAGDLVYILGETHEELGGSEYFASMNFIGNKVPKVSVENAMKLYKAFEAAAQKGLMASAESIAAGGLGASLARTAIAGGLGLEISLAPLSGAAPLRPDSLLFSESQSRFLVTVNPARQAEFEAAFAGLPVVKIGTVTATPRLLIRGANDETLVDTDIATLDNAYRCTFKGF
jgi:phosphoribosylformylglycinamidine synthase